ncbi:MAG: hypothetical protein AAGC68_00520 [Verrucomicrobiota bacterium]
MKAFAALFLLLLTSVGGILSFSYTFGKDSVFGRMVVGIVETSKTNFVAKVEEYIGENIATSFDPDRDAVRDACMNTMFLAESGFHFSQSKWGAVPVLFQFRNLRLTGPEDTAMNAADRMNGIDRRIVYKFQTDGFRRYKKESGWGPWENSRPPYLDSITMVRKLGHWQVASAPTRYYSIR